MQQKAAAASYGRHMAMAAHKQDQRQACLMRPLVPATWGPGPTIVFVA